MLHIVGNQFRGDDTIVSGVPYRTNVQEIGSQIFPLASTVIVGRSIGGSIIDNVYTPIIQQGSWQVLAASISAQLWLQSGFTGKTAFGLFSPIIGGVTLQPATPYSPTLLPWEQNIVVPPPTDQSKTFTIWDPATDPMPPIYPFSNPTNPLNIGGSLTLPQPLVGQSGSTLSVGIWMEPDIMSGTVTGSALELDLARIIINAQYVLQIEVKPTGQGPL